MKKAVNTLETTKDKVQKKEKTVKESAANAAQEESNIIEDVYGKTDDNSICIIGPYDIFWWLVH